MAELIYEKKGHLALITLNRPESRNALNYEMAVLWAQALQDFRDDPDLWVAIFTGNGPAFCAGADLKDLSKPDTKKRFLDFAYDRAPYLLNLDVWKPTIAAINGVAAGGGCEFALSCDIRVMADTARIGLTEAKVGMGANFGTHKLARMIPLGIALEKLFTGAFISSAEALQWGLANRVVSGEELMPTAIKIAEAIMECAPLSVRRMKENAMKGLEMPLTSAVKLNVGPDVYRSEDQL
ncbi:MAG TPA: enoyl-CoA hydratase/isomerase family protein, partial [Dehalococcoidales bacterium]|nr:enoyl-CoA hydratase/isomerase family protein [Dehalococcoidales bacterium]